MKSFADGAGCAEGRGCGKDSIVRTRPGAGRLSGNEALDSLKLPSIPTSNQLRRIFTSNTNTTEQNTSQDRGPPRQAFLPPSSDCGARFSLPPQYSLAIYARHSHWSHLCRRATTKELGPVLTSSAAWIITLCFLIPRFLIPGLFCFLPPMNLTLAAFPQALNQHFARAISIGDPAVVCGVAPFSSFIPSP